MVTTGLTRVDRYGSTNGDEPDVWALIAFISPSSRASIRKGLIEMRMFLTGVVGISVLMGGCSSDSGRPKVAPVSGKVTQKGKPLTEGDVVFTPSGGPEGAGTIATGQIGPDGTYRLTTYN